MTALKPGFLPNRRLIIFGEAAFPALVLDWAQDFLHLALWQL